jgi:O-antigen/teichoic acid export membrane protein
LALLLERLSPVVEPPVSATPVRRRMLQAALWLLGSNVSSQALRLLSNLLLARWLAPQAFGLIAVVNTLYFALVMFSDLGIWQSIVRSTRGNDPRMLGTAWSVQLLRGVVLALVVLATALGVHLAASADLFAADTVFADAGLPWMVAVFALCALIQGCESMKLACAQRDLRGRELARLELLTQLVATAVTLVLAWITRSPMALVAGSVVAAIARTLLSHFALEGAAARPCWDRSCVREIVGFGKWTLVSSVLGFVAAHGEKLMLGALLASVSFGVFSIASLLVAALAGVFASLNGHVVFARLSQAARSNPAELGAAYLGLQRVADAALGGVAGVLLVAGHWVVAALYDVRYQDAGWMLQWLALGLVAMRQQVVEQLMFALGKPQNVMANNLLRALALLVLVPSGHALAGEPGAVAAVVLSQFAGWPLSWRFRHEHGLLRWSTECGCLLAVALGALTGLVIDVALQ